MLRNRILLLFALLLLLLLSWLAYSYSNLQWIAILPTAKLADTRMPSPGREVILKSPADLDHVAQLIEMMRADMELLPPEVDVRRLLVPAASSVAIGNRDEHPNVAISYFDVLSNCTKIQTLFIRSEYLPENYRHFYTPLWPNVVCKLTNWPHSRDEAASGDVCVGHTNRRHFKAEHAQAGLPGVPDYAGVRDYSMFLHVIPRAFVDSSGNIAYGDVDIIPAQCRLGRCNRLVADNIQQHAEILVISQYWAEGYFHSMIEDVPRLVPYLPFLKRNSNVKIHVVRTAWITAVLQMLSLPNLQQRVISGPVYGAVVYVPQGGGCLWFNPIPGTILASIYQSHIHEHGVGADVLGNDARIKTSSTSRKALVFIVRTKKRKIEPSLNIRVQHYLSNMADKFDLDFHVFGDVALPPLDVTAALFARAAFVVAPHGAGLTNLVFSRHGTVVIEMLCNQKQHTTNPCYKDLAVNLGHRYHGILAFPSSINSRIRGWCGEMSFDFDYFINVTSTYMQFMFE